MRKWVRTQMWHFLQYLFQYEKCGELDFPLPCNVAAGGTETHRHCSCRDKPQLSLEALQLCTFLRVQSNLLGQNSRPEHSCFPLQPPPPPPQIRKWANKSTWKTAVWDTCKQEMQPLHKNAFLFLHSLFLWQKRDCCFWTPSTILNLDPSITNIKSSTH